MYNKYRSSGLAILAFPCNQFGGQEPGTNQDIKRFVQQYNVQFDMASKVDVNGPNAHPLFKYLTRQSPGYFGSFIKWNFTKFLIDREGVIQKRYMPQEDPYVIITIETLFHLPSRNNLTCPYYAP